MLWVEFSDPKTRQNKDRDVNKLEQLNEIQLFQRMMAQYVDDDDDDDDDHHHHDYQYSWNDIIDYDDYFFFSC
jgi:hypothetical protein